MNKVVEVVGGNIIFTIISLIVAVVVTALLIYYVHHWSWPIFFGVLVVVFVLLNVLDRKLIGGEAEEAIE